jgi:hypothetical protein
MHQWLWDNALLATEAAIDADNYIGGRSRDLGSLARLGEAFKDFLKEGREDGFSPRELLVADILLGSILTAGSTLPALII